MFNAVPTTDWGSPETLEHWRQTWAELCNAKFAEKGIDVRIDHRSYERQGVELLPTVHEGATVRAMKLGDGNAIVIGKCPKCGKDLYATKNQFRCAGVHFKKTGEKDGKAVFAQDGTCDFSIYRFVGPKDKPKKLTDKNGREIAEKGKTSLIKGIKKKSGDGTYDAYLTLNRETWSLDMQFPEFKEKKHKG